MSTQRSRYDEPLEQWMTEFGPSAAVTIAGLVLSPPMLVAAFVLGLVRRAAPLVTDWRAIVGGLGVVGAVVVTGLFEATWVAAWDAAFSVPVRDRLVNLGRFLSAAWAASQPQVFYAWARLLPLAPLFAWLLRLTTARDAAEQAREDQQRAEEREARRERRADRKMDNTPVFAKANRRPGIVLGRAISGERALATTMRGLVVVHPDRLVRHVLIAGATGAGKTETALRLAYGIALGMPSAQVFYLDAKGDSANAARFRALMHRACRHPYIYMFPEDRFDGWRGAPRDLQNRLLEIAGLPTEGDGLWYRYIADLAIGLACAHPDGPPRSSGDLLERLDLDALIAAHGGDGDVRALSKEKVADVRLRYAAFFAQVDGALDGDWRWEDTSCAYLRLPGLARKDERGALARYLFEDFSHYISTRTYPDKLCVLIVDEFSAIAQRGDMAERIEQARGFNTGLILVPQAVAGMGDPQQAARILGSVETVIVHRTNTPEDLAALAGTAQEIEFSQHTDQERHTGTGSARLQHQYKVDPNGVRTPCKPAAPTSSVAARRPRSASPPPRWAPARSRRRRRVRSRSRRRRRRTIPARCGQRSPTSR
jgi:hypothetical protein